MSSLHPRTPARDTILNWMHEDGYSLSEAGWIGPQDHKFYFEAVAEKDGHQHIARAPNRETAVGAAAQCDIRPDERAAVLMLGRLRTMAA